MKGISIDNGGSQVRILTSTRTLDNILTRASLCKKISNYKPKDIIDKYAVFEIAESTNPELIGYFACGDAGEMYTGNTLYMSNQETKTKSFSYYLQYVYAIAYAMAMDGDIGKNEDIILTACLPVREHSGDNDCIDFIKHKLAGHYVVKFPLLDFCVSFSISESNIGLIPEGAASLVLVNGIEPDDYTIIIDVGHITTDVSLFKGKQMFGKASVSSFNAGSVLLSNVSAALADAGYVVNADAASSAVATGMLKQGAKHIDVSQIVLTKEVQFIEEFVTRDVLRLLSTAGISASQVTNILFVGGVFTTDNASQLKTKLLEACSMKDARVLELDGCTARYLNIMAASKFNGAACAKLMG